VVFSGDEGFAEMQQRRSKRSTASGSIAAESLIEGNLSWLNLLSELPDGQMLVKCRRGARRMGRGSDRRS
jgi:hypothetical protein